MNEARLDRIEELLSSLIIMVGSFRSEQHNIKEKLNHIREEQKIINEKQMALQKMQSTIRKNQILNQENVRPIQGKRASLTQTKEYALVKNLSTK